VIEAMEALDIRVSDLAIQAILRSACGRGSVGRASPCQGEGRGFESRRPLDSTTFARGGLGIGVYASFPCERLGQPRHPQSSD
jgi:hypothetical protein